MAFLFLLVTVVLGVAGGWWFMNRRFRPLTSEGEGCLVCGSPTLAWIDDGAYHCHGRLPEHPHGCASQPLYLGLE